MYHLYTTYNNTYYGFDPMTLHSHLILAYTHAITCLSALSTVYKHLSRVASGLSRYAFLVFCFKIQIHVAQFSTLTLHLVSPIQR